MGTANTIRRNGISEIAFWDKNKHSLVIATHGFIKKSAKTPAKEIARAEIIMNEYYNRQK